MVFFVKSLPSLSAIDNAASALPIGNHGFHMPLMSVTYSHNLNITLFVFYKKTLEQEIFYELLAAPIL